MPACTIYTTTLVETRDGTREDHSEIEIWLFPRHIDTLHRIMEQAYGEGIDLYTLDLRDTELEEMDPELYGWIENNYYLCSYASYFENMVSRAYDRTDSLGILIDWDKVRAICAERYGYRLKDGVTDIDGDFQSWFKVHMVDNCMLFGFESMENLLDRDKSERIDFNTSLYIPRTIVDDFLKNRK